MKTILMIAIAAGAMLASVAPADARQGCGRGFHRAQHGRCISDRAAFRGGHGYRNAYRDGRRDRYDRHDRYRPHHGGGYR